MLPSKSVELYSQLLDVTFDYRRDNLSSNVSVDRVPVGYYEDFFLDYLITNRPCVLKACVTSNWRSLLEWVNCDGKPDFKYLSEKFGDAVIPVADCEVWEYDSQKKQDMVFSEYLNYWSSLNESQRSHPCLYLKDWHFNRAYPSYKAYEVPEYFTSDWLNEFCEHEPDDYRFVYMGPKGTWTPLHADVFGSYSWSANICGRKKWILFPPGTEKNFGKIMKKGSCELDYDCCSLGIEVIQEPGEVIFIPSGWYHQVWNLDDVISINHNWFNGCNIKQIWKCLTVAADNVRQELADIKDADGWEEQCQAILKLHHGMNYADFLRLLHFITHSRLENLKCDHSASSYGHWVFDIMSIKNVLSIMSQSDLSPDVFSEVKSMKEKISKFLSSIEL